MTIPNSKERYCSQHHSSLTSRPQAWSIAHWRSAGTTFGIIFLRYDSSHPRGTTYPLTLPALSRRCITPLYTLSPNLSRQYRTYHPWPLPKFQSNTEAKSDELSRHGWTAEEVRRWGAEEWMMRSSMYSVKPNTISGTVYPLPRIIHHDEISPPSNQPTKSSQAIPLACPETHLDVGPEYP